jgi:hypothetical protein
MNFFKKVAVLLSLQKHDENFKPEHLIFGEVVLETGETLVYDGEEIVVGMPIGIKTPDGVLPAPDGKHMTVDGMTVVIEGGQGVITEVIPAAVVEDKPVEQEEAAATPEASTPAAAEPERVLKSEVERIIQERERMFSDEKETMVAAHKKEVEALNELLSKQNEVIEKFNAEPSAEPVQVKPAIAKKRSSALFAAFTQSK